MKRTSNKLFLYSLTSLAVMASHVASAETLVTAPTLEGGISASIGALYLSPSADGQDYIVNRTFATDSPTTTDEIVEVNPDFDFGFEASLGYVFEDTANGIELLYRGINTSDDDSIDAGTGTGAFDNELIFPLVNNILQDSIGSASSTLSYELNAADLMINQFLDVGTHVQMRFSVGASYLNLESDQNSIFFAEDYDGVATEDRNSQFSGFGPRLAADGRYEFGDGFGLLGGASLAYYIGDMDVSKTFTGPKLQSYTPETFSESISDDINNHVVTNLRGNIGIDYVYFLDNEDRSTIGIELGYLVDYYADAVQQLNNASGSQQSSTINYQDSDSNALTFSGPYLEIKGVF